MLLGKKMQLKYILCIRRIERNMEVTKVKVALEYEFFVLDEMSDLLKDNNTEAARKKADSYVLNTVLLNHLKPTSKIVSMEVVDKEIVTEGSKKIHFAS